jgi:hypothetical protein
VDVVTARTIPANRTIYVESKIHIIECATCNIDFGIGDDFMRRRREDHGTFYCPNGHQNIYNGDNEAERLRKEVERHKTREQEAFDYATRERQRRLVVERQKAAAKGQLTKLKKRVAAGVCPCCNRTFANLGRHMTGQHPEYVLDAGVKP